MERIVKPKCIHHYQVYSYTRSQEEKGNVLLHLYTLLNEYEKAEEYGGNEPTKLDKLNVEPLACTC